METLLAPLGTATNDSVFSPDESTKDYKRMVEQLRNPNTETLQILMEEVTNVGAVQGGQLYIKITKGDLVYRAYRLGEAFQIVGTNAAPLFPELRSEFLSGRSTWGSECGLLFIGAEAWPVFLEGLTKRNQQVQIAAMSGLSFSNVPPSIAQLAFPYLCRFATNLSESVLFRGFAQRSIVELAVKPEIKNPALMRITNVETNWFNRCVIIDEIGYAGFDNKDVRQFLGRTSKDENKHVREMSEKALRLLDASRNGK
ncbi:MAG TPA: hypothetical protein VMA35_01865 [Candidatus Sulfopaludibacter sp.]|nr:hypothetical protein [Candidatus Sulfopaludibacter sp.]